MKIKIVSCFLLLLVHTVFTSEHKSTRKEQFATLKALYSSKLEDDVIQDYLDMYGDVHETSRVLGEMVEGDDEMNAEETVEKDHSQIVEMMAEIDKMNIKTLKEINTREIGRKKRKRCQKNELEPLEMQARQIVIGKKSKAQLLGINMLQFVGNYLNPGNANKMRQTTKQWRDVKVYENISLNDHEMVIFRHIDTEEILWVATEGKLLRSRETTIPNKEKLLSLLHRNDDEKWNEVFVWIAENLNKSQNTIFLTKLMLATARKHVSWTFINQFDWWEVYNVTPLMLAAMIDDTVKILELIKTGANVDRHNANGYTALHFAARLGNINACVTLLDNKANIDAPTGLGFTPLILAAYYGHENVLEMLMKREPNKTLTDSYGDTALQKARDQERWTCVKILQQLSAI